MVINTGDKAKTAITKQLYLLGRKVGFNELIKITGYCRATVNYNLSKLEKEGTVTKDKGARGKWSLTKTGRDIITIDALVEQVKSCKILSVASTSKQPTTETYVIMDFIKEPQSENPFEDNFQRASVDYSTFSSRVYTHRLDLTTEDISDLARKENLTDSDKETLKEKVLEALAKRMKKIVLVEVFEPSLLLKELKRRKEACPECGSMNIIEDSQSNEKVCKDCAYVID